MRLENNFLKEVQEAQARGDAQLHRIGIRINNQVKGEFKADNFTDKLIKDYADTGFPISDYIKAETDRLKNIYSALESCYGNLILRCEGARIISQYLDFISKDGINILSPKEDILKKSNHQTKDHYTKSLSNEGIDFLYEKLSNMGLLKEELQSSFYYVLGNETNKPTGFKKINWLGSQALLACFINYCIGEKDNNKWSIANKCFLVQGNETNPRSMAGFISSEKKQPEESSSLIDIWKEAEKIK